MPSTRSLTLALPLALAFAGSVATGALAAPAAPAASVPTAAHHSRPAQCRGQGVDAAARIRYSADVVIKAPLSAVWKLQTDVARWPSWQPPVLSAERLDAGRLTKGSRFRWTTPAPATPATPATTLEITSTVRQLRHGTCVLWSGPAIGRGLRVDEGVHLWTFTEVGGGVRVHTEETWTGAQVEADVPTATAALGAGLEAWLHDLKSTAEHHRK
ncbi:SRPBCC family protein [Streptomyces sp. NBC_00637]|uniref:SRPBCC family protein n=1 Tax=Streptomyces sp. NBC_00637 TaxID=2903667 RepID=UPI00324B9394